MLGTYASQDQIYTCEPSAPTDPRVTSLVAFIPSEAQFGSGPVFAIAGATIICWDISSAAPPIRRLLTQTAGLTPRQTHWGVRTLEVAEGRIARLGFQT